jgi:hypothetical protein
MYKIFRIVPLKNTFEQFIFTTGTLLNRNFIHFPLLKDISGQPEDSRVGHFTRFFQPYAVKGRPVMKLIYCRGHADEKMGNKPGANASVALCNHNFTRPRQGVGLQVREG